FGINGGLLNDAGTNAWFDAVYAAAPDLNQYISFVVTHKYESWLDYTTWRDHADWAYGKCSSGFIASRQEHFPTKPIYITELGSWKEAADKFAHYRACLNAEMYGNVFIDSAVACVQQWPTRWGEGVFYNNDNYTLTSMGLGMKAYTKFCHPNIIVNDNMNGIRYFSSVDPVKKAMTVWFVNHQESPQTVNCTINNFSASRKNAQWRLTSPGNDPNSIQTSLWQEGSITTSGTGPNCLFSTTLPPISVTVIVFESNSVSTEISAVDDKQLSFNIYPNPASKLAVISYQLSENSQVKISVCDLLGKELMIPVNEKQSIGEHLLSINTEQLQNGIYFVKMNDKQIQKLIINK
ncbi:MAG: T9SS type A sorting domain-containing protein, partial [Bacteroidetes bacterium]|nr:T9SS type A sorting domain-containing protein [Bacteroidota bacterium]